MNTAPDQFRCRAGGDPVTVRSWGGAECLTCGSVSMHMLPSHGEIAAFYATCNDNYTGGGSSGGTNLERYAQRYLELVHRHAARSGRLIDVGASKNPFPTLATASGFKTTVMDSVRPRNLWSQVKFVAGNVNERSAAGLERNSFDIVTCWAVLEHLPDPRLSASVLADLCRPGGTLLLSTPEIGTALTRYSLDRSPWFYPPEHLFLISPAAVRNLFEPLGCVMQAVSRLELNPMRYAARYGIGLAEAAIGLPVKVLSPAFWQRIRDSRLHSFQGISTFVLKKALAPSQRVYESPQNTPDGG
jgi:SAM-dependent methyltransferase